MNNSKLTVLAIDDEEKVRNHLKKHLSNAGYEVVTAGSKEEVEVELDRKEFIFAIVDLTLTSDEKYGGVKIVQYINNKSPSSKILILSGFNRTEEIDNELNRVRFDNYLSKGEKGNYIENVIKKLRNMTQKECFVVMPFSKNFTDVYELGIKAILKELCINCTRVDELHFSKSVLTQIYNGIKRADFLIADLTGNSSNVFYEIGYAHALRKEVILLAQNPDKIPFDFTDMNRLDYDKNKIADLGRKLKERIHAMHQGDYILEC